MLWCARYQMIGMALRMQYTLISDSMARQDRVSHGDLGY